MRKKGLAYLDIEIIGEHKGRKTRETARMTSMNLNDFSAGKTPLSHYHMTL
jgi:hypothetical protein